MSSFSLNSIIANKKRALEQKNGPPGKKRKLYLSRREIEEQKRLEEEKEKKETTKQESGDNLPTEESKKEISEEENKKTEEDKPKYDRDEVIKKLRAAGLVVTYFGETDRERERRWLKFDTESKEDFSFNKGTKNEFDNIMRALDSNAGDDEDQKTKEEVDLSGESFLQSPIEKIFDGLELCQEDRVLLMFRRLLEEWKLETKKQEDVLYKTVQGRKYMTTVKQSELYLRPLFKSLKQRTLSADILSCLSEVVDSIVARNYTDAGNFYIQMAVGNAPWPIGVTMVGIHERSAREKIFSNQVAHVLNDETQRKYIQSVYRLIKFCQDKYPAPPSRSIG